MKGSLGQVKNLHFTTVLSVGHARSHERVVKSTGAIPAPRQKKYIKTFSEYFLLMSAPGRENCVGSNAILYVECAWKSSLPRGLLRPQSLSRLPGKCRQNPSVLLLFLLSGSPTVGEKNILCRNYEIFEKLSQTCHIAKQKKSQYCK